MSVPKADKIEFSRGDTWELQLPFQVNTGTIAVPVWSAPNWAGRAWAAHVRKKDKPDGDLLAEWTISDVGIVSNYMFDGVNIGNVYLLSLEILPAISAGLAGDLESDLQWSLAGDVETIKRFSIKAVKDHTHA